MIRWSFLLNESGGSCPKEEQDISGLEALQWLLSCLRAQYWSYQQSHWQVKGSAAYGDHLLFQRLYESVQDQIDTLAEKMVALYGPVAVDGLDLGAKFETWIRRWEAIDCLHVKGLASEKDFQDLCKDVYDLLGELGELSLGMDDFLMATANEHETNQYLLTQATSMEKLSKSASLEWSRLFHKE